MLIEAGSRFDATTNIFSEINLNAINRLFVCLLSALASVLTVDSLFRSESDLVTRNSSSTKYQERHMQLHNLFYLLIAKLVFTFEKEFHFVTASKVSFLELWLWF